MEGNKKKLGSAAIHYGNSHAIISTDKYWSDSEEKDSLLRISVETFSHGDHEATINFLVLGKDADSLKKMGELLILAAREIERKGSVK